jgi:predicted transposase YdaD
MTNVSGRPATRELAGTLTFVQEGAGPRPYDVSVSYLIELDPEGWLDWIGLPADGPVESIETDVGTVLAEVDKMLLVNGPEPWIAHIEIQANRDPHLPARLLQYFGLVHYKRPERIETIVVLLRPEADGPELTGKYAPQGDSGPTSATIEHHVVRLWERPADELVNGGIGVSPLAPLASIDQAQLSNILVQIVERFRREADDSTASELRNALTMLLNLRYDDEEVQAMLLDRIDLNELRDTPVYRVIARMGREEGREEGRLTQTRRLLLSLGTDKLGPPDEATVAALTEVDDITALERTLHRLLTANTWAELLALES